MTPTHGFEWRGRHAHAHVNTEVHAHGIWESESAHIGDRSKRIKGKIIPNSTSIRAVLHCTLSERRSSLLCNLTNLPYTAAVVASFRQEATSYYLALRQNKRRWWPPPWEAQRSGLFSTPRSTLQPLVSPPISSPPSTGSVATLNATPPTLSSTPSTTTGSATALHATPTTLPATPPAAGSPTAHPGTLYIYRVKIQGLTVLYIVMGIAARSSARFISGMIYDLLAKRTPRI